MEIDISIHKTEKPIAVMHIRGEIDGSNYLDVVTKAQELYKDKTARDLIVDLSDVTEISTTGLTALHQISLVYGGIEHDIEEDGTELRPDITHSSSARKHVKLLNPQPEVDKALQFAGLKLFFKVFGDLESAIHSFQQ
jgi:anti-anti-sigma regulatory factor